MMLAACLKVGATGLVIGDGGGGAAPRAQLAPRAAVARPLRHGGRVVCVDFSVTIKREVGTLAPLNTSGSGGAHKHTSTHTHNRAAASDKRKLFTQTVGRKCLAITDDAATEAARGRPLLVRGRAPAGVRQPMHTHAHTHTTSHTQRIAEGRQHAEHTHTQFQVGTMHIRCLHSDEAHLLGGGECVLLLELDVAIIHVLQDLSRVAHNVGGDERVSEQLERNGALRGLLLETSLERQVSERTHPTHTLHTQHARTAMKPLKASEPTFGTGGGDAVIRYIAWSASRRCTR